MTRVGDFVLELQVAEPKTVGPGAGDEIGATDVIAGVVLRLIHLEAIGKERALGLDLRIVEAEEKLDVVWSDEIQTAQSVGIRKRRIESPGETVEGGGILHRHEQALIGPVALRKVEQFVLDEGAAHTATVLVAVIVGIGEARRLGQRGIDIAAAVILIAFAVDGVRPDLVETLTTPDELRSLERSIVDCAIWNSWMALAAMLPVVVPTVSSEMSVPST